MTDPRHVLDSSAGTLAVVAVAALVVGAAVPSAVAQSGSNVVVSGLDPTSTTVTKGETATVSADVENPGESRTTAAVELVVDPGESGETVLATEPDVELSGGETETVTFSGVDVDLDPGTYDYVVRSGDDATSTGTMTVRDPATFAVEIDDGRTDEEVPAGSDATVVADVRNTGDVSDTQTVTLEVDGAEVNTTTLTLDGGENRSVSLAYSTTEADAPSVDATVRTDDDYDTTRASVLAPAFDVTLDDATTTAVVGGENVTLVAEVTNVGSATGTETVTFEVGGDRRTETVTLAPDESETRSVATFATNGSDAPSLDAAVTAGDSEATTTVSVLEPARFEVVVADDTFDGATATVVAEVTNAGDVGGTQTVAFEVDDERAATTDLTLAAGDSDRVTFSHEFAAGSSQVDAVVRTDDDFAATTVARANVDAGPAVEAVTPSKTDGGESVTVTYTAAGDRVRDVRLLVHGPDGEELYNRSVATGRSVDATLPESASEAGEGEYAVTVRAVDRAGRSVADEGGFTVDAAYDPDRAVFAEDVYYTPAGDLVQVKLLIPDGEEAYVLVGGDRMVGDDGVNNYLDLLYVRNDDGGAVTFTVNTRLVGTDVPSQWAYASGGDTVVSYDHRHGGDADPAETTAFASAAFVDSDGHTVAETLAGLREAVDVTTLPRPLQSARYRLVAGGDDTVVVREDPETPDMANPLARTNLVLTDPEVSNVTTYVAPRASAQELAYGDERDTRLTPGNLDRVLDRTTRRDTVALGDRLVVEVEATGLYGALLASAGPPAELGSDRTGDPVVDDGVGPAVLADLLGYHEGISLTVTETNPGQNTRETRLRLRGAAEGDVYVVPDTGPPNSQGAAIERFYVVFDTRASAPFTDPLDGGDRFEFEFAYESPPNERYAFGDGTPPAPFDPRNRPTENGTEHFPYLGDRETTDSERATFAVEAPSVRYDNRTVDGDEVVVSDGAEATLAGETNVAPGSDVTIQLVSKERTPPKVITIDDVTVEPDGSFSVRRDLSTLDPGANVEVEFYVYQQLVDKRPAVVVDGSQNPVAFEVVDLTEEATVARGETLGDVSVTIRNTGVLDGRESIEFRLDGETVSQRRILVNRGDDWTGRFAGVAADLGPGEYRYTVVTPDDEASGTLVVTATAGNATTSTPAETTPAGETTPLEYAPGENSPSEREAPERLPESSSGGFPGVGFVRPRDALGGIALVGAVYVVGNWV